MGWYIVNLRCYVVSTGQVHLLLSMQTSVAIGWHVYF